MLTLFTTDGNGIDHAIHDATGLKWSTHYSASGSGSGYLNFTLPREVGRYYSDIGFGYEVTLMKSMRDIKFHGQIRSIEESSSETDKIEVRCLGDVVIAGDKEILRAFSDTRVNMWTSSEKVQSSRRPDRYTMGTAGGAIYIHPNNGQELDNLDYTTIDYHFYPDEIAERIVCDVSLCLGAGSVFDGTVSSVSGQDVYYANDAGEGQVASGMILYNLTRGNNATVSSINTGSNYITVVGTVSDWVNGDELAVYGPLFSAQISSISSATITYTGDTGEGNLPGNERLINTSKKSVALIGSNDTGANTITVTNANHVSWWEEGDTIALMAPYFSAVVSSVAGTTLTYSSPIGERLASSTTGWILYNETQDDYAEVGAWNIASNELTAAGISEWVASDLIRIYTPFRVTIYQMPESGAGSALWPTTQPFEAMVVRPGERAVSKDLATAGTPTRFRIAFQVWLPGSADENSFVSLSDMSVRSIEANVTASSIAEDLLSDLADLGISSDTDSIESIAYELEPVVFEFTTIADALTWACEQGDGSGNLLAWGIDENKVLYLETQDKGEIKYFIRRPGASVSSTGDLQESWQRVMGVYQDRSGQQKYTDWVSDTDFYFGNNRYRSKYVKLDNIDNETAANTAIQLYLDENKMPKGTGAFTVSGGSVYNRFNVPLAIEDLDAGGMIAVQDWRSSQVYGETDMRKTFVIDQVAAVEIDYDDNTATITPGSAKSSFQTYMKELSRLIHE